MGGIEKNIIFGKKGQTHSWTKREILLQGAREKLIFEQKGQNHFWTERVGEHHRARDKLKGGHDCLKPKNT